MPEMLDPTPRGGTGSHRLDEDLARKTAASWRAREVERSISVSDPRPSAASVAIERAAVTERVGLEVARLEGSGVPEGIPAAAVMKCLGGEMQARMWPTQRSWAEKLVAYGLDDPERKLALDDLIRGDDVVFAATGVTPGESLRGVEYFRGGVQTNTVAMSTAPRVVRFMDIIHALEPEARAARFP